MMLFQPHHIPLIQDHTKTQSRRMWDIARVKEGSFQQVKTKIFTKEHHGYLKVEKVYRQQLLDITEEDAQKEGGYTREKYLAEFRRIYPHVQANPLVFVVEFEYVGMSKEIKS